MSDDMNAIGKPHLTGNPERVAKPPVTTSLERLERSIGELSESLSDLIRALNPILTPEEETDGDPISTGDTEVMSELAGILTDDNARIRSVIFRMNQLAGRLEI